LPPLAQTSNYATATQPDVAVPFHERRSTTHLGQFRENTG